MSVKIKFEKSQNLKVVFDRLKKISKIDEDEKITYTDAFELAHIEWIVHSLIDFGVSLSNSSQKKIIRKAFRQMVINEDFSNKFLLDNLNKALKIHKSSRLKEYQLLATISIKNLPFRKINIGNSIVIIHGKEFPKSHASQRIKSLKRHMFELDEIDYTKVSILHKSNNFEDAFKECIDVFEIFRSFLCLLLNKSLQIRYGDRFSKPINLIGSSEVFTLHELNGSCIDERQYWYTPRYRRTDVLIVENDLKNSLKTSLKSYVNSFNKCMPKHRTTIQKALEIYVTAFDENDKHLCFLKAWTALEILMNTDQNDKVIKRILAMFMSKTFIKQELECLRIYRNEFVHSGKNELDPLFACYRLQTYIRKTIDFNFKYSGFFNNIEESVFFLDNFNPNIKALKTRKAILERAIFLKQKINSNDA